MAKSKLTVSDIRALKGQRKLTCLTAYNAPMAAMVGAHVDMILVGDSLGMVQHGLPSTIGVTLDMMILHGAAVVRGLKNADINCFVIVDMPYGSYEHSADDALTNAQRILHETGAHAVKLEGGADMEATIAHLVQNGVPVMGHIGLQPQSVEKEGGYKVKGRSDEEIARLLDDARAVERAGSFSFVLEGTVSDVSTDIANLVNIPVIGIGASPACDGQVLVTDDMLGLHTGHVPKFVKQYAQLSGDIDAAVQSFCAEVASGAFPAAQHMYAPKQAAKKKAS